MDIFKIHIKVDKNELGNNLKTHIAINSNITIRN